ncbi:MAG: dual specificity protein phosphatase family protein [Rhabdochlamydiaceae bacterium]
MSIDNSINGISHHPTIEPQKPFFDSSISKINQVAQRSFSSIASAVSKSQMVKWAWIVSIITLCSLGVAGVLSINTSVVHPHVYKSGLASAMLAGVLMLASSERRQKLSFEISQLHRLLRKEQHKEVFSVNNVKIYIGPLPNQIKSNNELVAIAKEDENFKAILSINEDWETKPIGPSFPYPSNIEGINRQQILAKDHTPLTNNDLQNSANFINTQIQEGNSIYVHCRAGKGRSAMAIAAYLIKYQKKSPEEAVQMIKKANPQSTIQKYKEQLYLFEESINLDNQTVTGNFKAFDEQVDTFKLNKEYTRPLDINDHVHLGYQIKYENKSIQNMSKEHPALSSDTLNFLAKYKATLKQINKNLYELKMKADVIHQNQAVSVDWEQIKHNPPLDLAAYLIKYEYKNADEAIGFIQEKLPGVNLSDDKDKLELFEAACLKNENYKKIREKQSSARSLWENSIPDDKEFKEALKFLSNEELSLAIEENISHLEDLNRTNLIPTINVLQDLDEKITTLIRDQEFVSVDLETRSSPLEENELSRYGSSYNGFERDHSPNLKRTDEDTIRDLEQESYNTFYHPFLEQPSDSGNNVSTYHPDPYATPVSHYVDEQPVSQSAFETRSPGDKIDLLKQSIFEKIKELSHENKIQFFLILKSIYAEKKDKETN